jgi:AcrR family transcriptional regulator
MKSTVKPPRTRRAERAEETRRRILDAATSLFLEAGFANTAIEAIATRADVAVETVYSRFRNKANLLDAILAPAVSGQVDGSTVLDRPEFQEIRSCPDQRTRLRLLAHFSRGILERTSQIHQILQTAAAVDANAAEIRRSDQEYRLRVQRSYIDLLLTTGPLREGLTPEVAADTYSALSNPTTYAFFTRQRGWTPDQFEEWLAESLTRLLLP